MNAKNDPFRFNENPDTYRVRLDSKKNKNETEIGNFIFENVRTSPYTDRALEISNKKDYGRLTGKLHVNSSWRLAIEIELSTTLRTSEPVAGM